jgi:uncharacterized membrane protein
MRQGDRLVIGAGTALGVGLGGFVDGILLHQILQWHGMVSSVVPPVSVVAVKVNMLGDGLFHAVMWFTTVTGVVLLARAVSAPRGLEVARPFAASVMLGWGMFNVVEGLVDHQLLGLHHVHPGENQVAWDVGYLVVSALLACAGALLLVRSVTSERLHPAV